MASVVLGPIVDATISKVIAAATEQINLAVSWKVELKRLCSKLDMIRAVLQDAESRQVGDVAVKLWLGKLRDVVREAEDVLDEVVCERREQEVRIQKQMEKKVCLFFTFSNRFIFRLKMANKIKNLIASIVEINEEATEFGLQSRLASHEPRSNPQTTYSCPSCCPRVIGREDDVSTIVDLLVDSSNKEPLSVISVVGKGGLGKTTLRAFGGSSVCDLELEAIGKQIAKKCRGVPLVANVIGASLSYRRDRGEWVSVDNNFDAWGTSSSGDDSGEWINQALQLSFDHLPNHLKQCFAFCSIFPKDFEIEKAMLIQLWMAEGFLQPSKRSSMEDIGDKYFNDLLSYSLFLDEERDSTSKIKSCKMHGLIHNLATSISKSETLTLKAGSEGNIAQVLHLNLVDAEEMVPANFVEVAGKLHSLFLKGDVLCKMPDSFKRLRILSCGGHSLWGANTNQLPTWIGEMKHLRYLDISYFQIKELPQIIMELYSLQTLRLKDLQTLQLFVVGPQEGSQIEELGCLSQLRGELRICNLEHIENSSEARKAKLSEKIGLHELRLEWADRNPEECSYDEDVLAGLKPPSYLRNLTMEYYGGEQCPSWMKPSLSQSFSLNNLGGLKISSCKKLKSIPSMSGLSSLEQLQIGDCLELTRIGDEEFAFPMSLRQLHIWSCPRLGTIGESMSTLTCLEELDLSECKDLKLVENFIRLVCLERLEIGGFSKESEEFPCLNSIHRLHAFLQVLVLCGWEKLTYLPPQIQRLTSLRELGIAVQPFSKLQLLQFIDYPELKKGCAKGSSLEWFKNFHIPDIEIDYVYRHPTRRRLSPYSET
ncbi:hypothetical protein SLEP1_g12188 [Rubroshorea leprosula]|uniref:Uncharacterized protein n=1 Tax=Rubroshorea leprosula TaxID=152421 RepID=A0AAV5IHJ0_9ROSI|nr:hypothetical protein SLEP1_g12188 [Rubroshorea leprosula]